MPESSQNDGDQPGFYIVATPIGNRDDISNRAIQILGDVDFIVAEDTRHTGQLMAYFGIKKPLISFRDAPTNTMDRLLKEIQSRLNDGESGAYVTDAGTPGISDPGWRLVQAVLAVKVPVSPIPGASAAITLLSVADQRLDEFRFVGFLPKKHGYHTKLIELINYLNYKEPRGVVFYESPQRVQRVLGDVLKHSNELYVIIGRELTKKFETIYRGSLNEELIASLPNKGEYVILLIKKP